MEDIVKSLASINSFSSLTLDNCQALAKLCHPRVIESGTVIAREGVVAEELFAIINGQVHIWMDYGTNKADLLTIRSAPVLVGEMSVIDEEPRSATIVANTELYAYVMDAVKFRMLLKERGDICLALSKELSQKIRMSNDSFISELRLRNFELLETNEELQKVHEQLMRKERLSSLGKFSSMIMHDLKNPLFAIIAYLDLMNLNLGTQLSNDHEVKTYLEHIRRETNRITKLTNEWLDYSNGNPSLNYTPVTIDDLFCQLQDNINSIKKPVGMLILWQNDSINKLLVDVDRILRSLVNLVDNAIKASSENDIITIAAKEYEDTIRIDIQDNGTGMDNETQKHVFDPFFTHSNKTGNGLGMYIVKTIVEAHQGRVEVNSSLGQGTTISLHLPMRF